MWCNDTVKIDWHILIRKNGYFSAEDKNEGTTNVCRKDDNNMKNNSEYYNFQINIALTTLCTLWNLKQFAKEDISLKEIAFEF